MKRKRMPGLKRYSGCITIFFDKEKVIPVIGNLSDDGIDALLIANNQLKDINVIIHSAANTSFAKIYDDVVKKVNLNGLQQILNWSKTLLHLDTFTYVGTATIIGKGVTDRLIFEDESPSKDSVHFVKYTYTKMMGELMIHEVLPENKILIVRPSIILGDSRARIPRSNVILWTLAAVNMLRLIPVRPAPKLDIISVDFAACAIDALLFSKRKHTVYHVSAGEQSCSTNLKLTEAIAPHFQTDPTLNSSPISY
ncbi:fatty acyl-CoA reductase 2 [Filimonas sp.]|nr:fatty acyl-CoA reductase 2 [Filimonas sp.]